MLSMTALGIGLLLGGAASLGEAQMKPPSEHKGVSVASLGVLAEESLRKQLGLNGYVMQLREITLQPGGAIAKHSHATRPGLVWIVEGSWTEGRGGHPGIDGGERTYAAGDKIAILEDARTEHWFYNRGSTPARAVVCDIVPATSPPS